MKTILTVLMASLIIISIFTVTFNVPPAKAYGTIYIRPDGSVDPFGTPIGRIGSTYYFGSNIADSIEIQRSNIILDGQGYTLFGVANQTGIYIGSGVNNVTVRSIVIQDFMYGIQATGSSYDTFNDNWLISNDYGIYLYSSNYSNIFQNNLLSNNCGIGVAYSLGDIIFGNTITYGNYGIYIFSSPSSQVSGNTISSASVAGIYMYTSGSGSIFANTISNNYYGIYLVYAWSNKFDHNNFIYNSVQVGIYESGYFNTWDNGYPSGGNYWSDYTGTDIKRGAEQDLSGSDGIGDTPYEIVSDNPDNYPLMGLFGPSTPTGENVTVFPTDEVCIIFEMVTEEGLTIVEKPGGGPAPPPFITILQYYVIETSATYSGQIQIRIVFNGGMGKLSNPSQEDGHLLQVIMLEGDIDEDFDVDIFDLVRIAGVYGVASPDPRYAPNSNCDLDKDGDIDIFDVVRLARNYGRVWDPATGWDDVTTGFDPETNSIFGVTQHVSIFGVTFS